MIAAAAPCAGTASTSNQIKSVRISKPIPLLYRSPIALRSSNEFSGSRWGFDAANVRTRSGQAADSKMTTPSCSPSSAPHRRPAAARWRLRSRRARRDVIATRSGCSAWRPGSAHAGAATDWPVAAPIRNPGSRTVPSFHEQSAGHVALLRVSAPAIVRGSQSTGSTAAWPAGRQHGPAYLHRGCRVTQAARAT